MGAILRYEMRQAADHLGGCIEVQADHGRVFGICSEPTKKPVKGMLTGPLRS